MLRCVICLVCGQNFEWKRIILLPSLVGCSVASQFHRLSWSFQLFVNIIPKQSCNCKHIVFFVGFGTAVH